MYWIQINGSGTDWGNRKMGHSVSEQVEWVRTGISRGSEEVNLAEGKDSCRGNGEHKPGK